MTNFTMQPLSDEEMQLVYNWVDQIPLSRPKKNITRDFSDGVLLAQIIHYYMPSLVQIHNYSGQHSIDKKMYNWETLNQKVLKKIKLTLSKMDIENVVRCQPDAIEKVLKIVRRKMEQFKEKKQDLNQMDQEVTRRAVGPTSQSVIKPVQQWNLQTEVDTDMLIEKEQRIQELRETIEILEMKIKKLEQLVGLKDSKIQALTLKLQELSKGIQ